MVWEKINGLRGVCAIAQTLTPIGVVVCTLNENRLNMSYIRLKPTVYAVGFKIYVLEICRFFWFEILVIR